MTIAPMPTMPTLPTTPTLSTVPTTPLAGIACVGYLRVSTEAQAGEKQTSLADQRAAIAQLAAKLGCTIGHVFQDAGISGATMEFRPGMRELIASCEASPRSMTTPGYVVVLNDSRWGRFANSEHATYWRVHLERRGWLLRFAEMDEIQDDTVRPVLRAIVQSQASLYRKTLKANVLRGTRGQAEQGYWQAKAPFGYARRVVYPPGRERVLANTVPKATDEKILLTPDPAEAPIVRAVFDRYGAGTESLTSLLEWASVAYPARAWTRAALLRMLTNPAYVGDVVWGRVSVEPGHRETRSDDAWYGKRDAHEPIVSRAVFAAAQQRLAVNRRRTRGVRSDWVLSGLIACRCGRAFTGAGNAGAGPVYSCSSRGAQPSRRCSYPGAVTKRLLETATIAVLAKEIGSVVHRRAMAAALERATAAVQAAARTVDQVTRDAEAVEQRQRRVLAAIEMGTITSLEARDRMRELRGELARLVAERDAIHSMAGGSAQAGHERDRLVARASDFRTMAQQLQGPALRELIRPWIQRAEFNTETRELMIEIRRVPVQGAFGAEGEPSAAKGSAVGTVVRRVIVRRGAA